jgi:gas vesicle protein
MGQDPEVIREEIERTRAEMTQTVDALGYKADVKSRAKENVQDKVDSVKDRITGAAQTVTGTVSEKTSAVTGTVADKKDAVTGTVSDRTPDAAQVKQKGKQAVSVAQGNPLGLAIGSVALGFLAGMLIPETQKEHQVLGEMADTVKDQVRDTASEAVDRGKQVAQEVAEQTTQTVKETGQQAAQEHGSALKDSAADSAQQVRGQV